ncbi:class I SAM-dependent methyltransferase [Rhizobium leguminosarum]|uniref:class I SAM-dependent methyltransferase n=1 Tax=Rhizobium leguminosarum TaxID=384 RepID=UPI001C97801B|nr:class I SAM-dependent methyltransferase [Rhizobium leguminosarum]MBY5519610.1 class I SAM-dependent methyltransferase [Rhizobium leguminosarum]
MESAMKRVKLDQRLGREAFGDDPANYHRARPSYPKATWAALRERAGLKAGIDILEIGAGSGLATMALLGHRPRSLVAVEPDGRLADYLRTSIDDPCLDIVEAPFETADLKPASFDLVAAATMFHWLDPTASLKKIHGLLRPDGAVALWWNVFGDTGRPDAFHDETVHLFASHPSSLSSGDAERLPHGLDTGARVGELAATGFITDEPQFLSWTLTLDPAAVRRLYTTYSNVATLPPVERDALLDALEAIAASRFGGCVERNMTTAIYIARRRSSEAGH